MTKVNLWKQLLSGLEGKRRLHQAYTHGTIVKKIAFRLHSKSTIGTNATIYLGLQFNDAFVLPSILVFRYI